MKMNPLQMKLLLLPKQMIKIKKMNKIRMVIKIKIKIWAMVKGELSKMKIGIIKKSQDHHHLLTQELDKPFNVTIRSTIFLVT
jgi:transcription antitermination factor NusA-like protein